jgi:hypothetical protein
MKYAAEMGSHAMIKIPGLITMGSRGQKLITQIRRQHGGHISLFPSYQNKEHRLGTTLIQRSKKIPAISTAFSPENHMLL